MVNYVYFVKVVPFRICKKTLDGTRIVSNKGIYQKVDSALLADFKEGDDILKSMLIGREGIIQTDYFKSEYNKVRKYLSAQKL